MNLAILFGLFVIIGLKIPHSTDANDDTFDRKLLQRVGEKNARKLRLPYSPRMRLYRRKMNARRYGYFRHTTETLIQSYDSWGAGGQLDLMQEEYGNADTEEYDLPQESLDYMKALRARLRLEGHNAAERENKVNKLLMKGREAAQKAKAEEFFEMYKYKGDWVLGRNVTIRPSDVFNESFTTTRRPAYYNDRSCLRPCPLIYKFDYGMICAIRWHRPKPTGTHNPNDWFETKSGTSQYPTYFLRNFTNLCEMEVINCLMLKLDTDSIYSWKVMFRGPCPKGMDDEQAILDRKGPPGNPPPLTDPEKEIELVNNWFKDFDEVRREYVKARLEKAAKMKEMLNKSRTAFTKPSSSSSKRV